MQEARTGAGAAGRWAWDVFCRVIDNFGDVGVCWRVARGLAAEGQRVRLVIDDPSALVWMAPGGAPGVELWAWPGPGTPGDVVVEAFGCDPPSAFVAAMAGRQAAGGVAPLWLDLEYLSAEPYVERSHGLPSPRPDGLVKWFFFPGFTPRTGGLLRERGLEAERVAFDGSAWLAAHGWLGAQEERRVSLFCYDGADVPALLADVGRQPGRPAHLLLTPGAAQRQAAPALATLPADLRARLRTTSLPWLPQPDYDRLLWACDLNAVRGEDSLVRALWAGRPFLWQAYPQDDGAHGAKVEALAQHLALPDDVRGAWRAWNGMGAWPGLPRFDSGSAWQQAGQRAAAAACRETSGVQRLLEFAAAHLVTAAMSTPNTALQG